MGLAWSRHLFLEGNPQRALKWAEERKVNSGQVKSPFVIGAVIDLKRCLDLLDSSGIQQVRDAYLNLKVSFKKVGKPLPVNTGKEKSARVLDCLVINSLHDYLETNNRSKYDSVRAMFPEGEELYTGAGFKDKNHIQLCIRDKTCIKGYFRPIIDW